MSSFSDQLEETKALIQSNSKANKSLGYPSLLRLQVQSSDDLSSIQALADASPALISTIAVDISVDDEEIAAQALKCLGFIIYHPSLIASISVADAGMVLDALAKVIMHTKIKSVCNLGVWCISMQQLDESILAAHFHLVLRAVVHALDNPLGSLSTTFEALQAVIKLAAQLNEKMREASDIWAPLIYRRLLSIDKKERDMSERCLLKIRPVIFPLPAALSKAVAWDVKWQLLTTMKDLLNQGMKVQVMQAWGWFIRLLGSHAINNRHMINDMLKIPEQTFCDRNPQVQIASQVAWEGLIDALIHPPFFTCETDEGIENGVQQMQLSGESYCEIRATGFSKSIKLIMTPLVGIISSKCDVTVHTSCLNTWCYLLHKLNIFINHPVIIELVLDPILEAVFHRGPDIKTIWLWNQCLDLLDDILFAKCRDENYEVGSQDSHHALIRSSMRKDSMSAECLWKQHPITWLPWSVNRLSFFIKMIDIIISHASVLTITPKYRSLASAAALRIFRSLLKGIQREFKSSSINYNDIMLCLKTILGFMKKMCEGVNSNSGNSHELCYTSLQFLEVLTEELGTSILGSPLYKVALDLKCIENLQSVKCTYGKILGINPVTYMDMVSPVVYLIVLCICVATQSTSDNVGLILQGIYKIFKCTMFSYYPLENLLVTVGLLYKYVDFRNLQIWMTIAKGLKDCIHSMEDHSLLNMESHGTVLCHILTYPFVVFSSLEQNLPLEKGGGSLEESCVSTPGKLELQHAADVWKSMYSALCASAFKNAETNCFNEDLCSMLNRFIDENISMLNYGIELDSSYKDLGLDLISFWGNTVTCMLEQIVISASGDRSKNKHASHHIIFSGINTVLGFTARFLKVSWSKIGGDPPTVLLATSSVFSALARLVCSLHLKQIIISFMEIITCPLLLWLSHKDIPCGSASGQLQNLWAEMLGCLRRSQPPIIFDSTFLKLQAPLLEKTLDHPNSTISEFTIAFWNSTYGEEFKLDYPESLLEVIDKLSRHKKIILHKKSFPFFLKCHSKPEGTARRYVVTATHNRISKRVELVEDTMNQTQHRDQVGPYSKRKRLELTEHQKEVRRAQQGRAMDCNGHGPGLWLYTSADFSQGNEDSQESQELRDPESILEMLKRVA